MRNEVEGVGELRAADLCPVALAVLFEFPVADPDAGLILGEAGPAEAGAGCPLVVAQAPQAWVGEGGVGEDQLAWREGARACLADPGADPEEGRLKPQRAAVCQGQPAGRIPPFAAERRMGPVVGGEDQLAPRNDARELDFLRSGAQRRQAGQRKQEGAAIDYQSSRTASRASWRIAWRPASTAARAASATRLQANTASEPQGTWISMLQWKL